MTDTDNAPQTPHERRTEPRRWEEVLAPSYTSKPASEGARSRRLQRPRWLDRAAKDLTGDLKR